MSWVLHVPYVENFCLILCFAYDVFAVLDIELLYLVSQEVFQIPNITRNQVFKGNGFAYV